MAAPKMKAPLASLETKYCAHLAWQYETVEFLGLPYLKDERPLTLQEIYVPLSLTSELNGKERLFVPDAFEKSKHLVVLGDPGSGKSTLVKLLTYSFARSEPTPLARRLGPHLPIPIILRDYNVREWQKPTDMFQDFIDHLDEKLKLEMTIEWLMSALVEGRGILLLDGLDEVGNVRDREHLRDKVILPLLCIIPECLAVLTSRIIGYEEAPIDVTSLQILEGTSFDLQKLALKRFYVAPFNEAEVDQFINRWYTVRERDERERKSKIISLRKALQGKEQIKRLAANPALLTLMALIHRVTADLPSGRVRLYDKITEAYLETIQKNYRLRPYEASLEQMKHWLASVGWEMQCRRDGTNPDNLFASKEDVLAWLREAMQEDCVNPEVEAREFLDYIARRSGLLIPRGPNQYAFTHLTIQEYFAAWHLRELIWQQKDLINECVRRVSDDKWHETIILLYEMLAEFRGAGDNLANALLARAQSKPSAASGTAELFAELLLDDQVGLTSDCKTRIIQFLLEFVCNHGNKNILERLVMMPISVFNIPKWLDQRLETELPEVIGPSFFIVWAAFNSPGIESEIKLLKWVNGLGKNATNRNQITQVALIGAKNEQVFVWAIKQLSVLDWLVPVLNSTSLADIYIYRLLESRSLNTKSHFLGHLGTALIFSRFITLRAIVMKLSSEDVDAFAQIMIDREYQFSKKHIPNMLGGAVNLPKNHIDLEFSYLNTNLLESFQTLRTLIDIGFFTMGRATSTHIQHIVLFSLNHTLRKIKNGITIKTIISDTDIIDIFKGVKFFFPDDTLKGFNTYTKLLHDLLHGQDDWTRLLGLTALIAIGEGTKDICIERNKILDQGMNNSSSFTFPKDISDVALKEGQINLPNLLEWIFLHEINNPWIHSEWYDEQSSAFPFFRAKPNELFSLVPDKLSDEQINILQHLEII